MKDAGRNALMSRVGCKIITLTSLKEGLALQTVGKGVK